MTKHKESRTRDVTLAGLHGLAARWFADRR
jgi:hypothetical protein